MKGCDPSRKGTIETRNSYIPRRSAIATLLSRFCDAIESDDACDADGQVDSTWGSRYSGQRQSTLFRGNSSTDPIESRDKKTDGRGIGF
jgi:hypothetical protein